MVANPARIRIPATHRVAGVSMVAPSAPRDARSKTPPGPEGSNGIDRRGCRGKLAGPSPCVALVVASAHGRTGARPWRRWQAAAPWWDGGGGFATVPPAARVVEPHLGSSSQPLSARYAKRPLRGASRIWRREGDSLGAARLALRAVAAPPCHPLRGWSNPTWGPHRNLSPPDTQNAPCGALRVSGGERGIRTPEALFRRLHTFQACSFNHSDTSPGGPGGRRPAARRGRKF
jgi:hypothetical protein